VLLCAVLVLGAASAYHMSPEQMAEYRIGEWVCDEMGNGCHIDYVMHYFYQPFGGEHYVYECEAVIEAAYWSRNPFDNKSTMAFYRPQLCEGPFYGMCGQWVYQDGGQEGVQAAFNDYNQWGWEYWRTEGSGYHCGPVYGGPTNPWPDPEPDEDCIVEYQSGTDTRMCEQTLQGVLGLLREWLQILLRRSASPDPGGPGPPGDGGGAGPPGGGGGADPDDPSPVSPAHFAPHDERVFWGEIPLLYVDLQVRLDAVRVAIDQVSVDRFPFVVMRYVPELAEDGSPASPCNDIVITLVGTPTALGWCGSGVQAFLTGWGRSIMGVLVTVVYGFGMAHTVVRS
jgi:hypothetical protein